MVLKIIFVVCVLLNFGDASVHDKHHEDFKLNRKGRHYHIHNKQHGTKETTRCNDMKCSLICPIDVLFRPNGSSLGKPGVDNSPTTHSSASSTSKPVNKKYRNINKPEESYAKDLTRHFLEGKHNQKQVVVRRFKIKTKKNQKRYSYRELLPNGCHVVCNSDKHQGQLSQSNPQEAQSSVQDESGQKSSEEVDDKPIEATASPGETKIFQRPYGPIDFMGANNFGWPGIDIV